MQWRQKKTTSQSENRTSIRERKRRRRQPKADEPQTQEITARLSRLNKPEDMSLEDWQIELRRQFGREQAFTLKNLGEQPIFSEFEVTNPQSQSTYRVHIRGTQPGDNTAPAPISPPTRSAPASTSNSPWPPWNASAAAAGSCGRASSRATARSISNTAPSREVRFRPGTCLPGRAGPPGCTTISAPTAPCCPKPSPASRPSWPRPAPCEPRAALPRRRPGLRRRGARRRAAPAARDRGVSARHPQCRVQGPAAHLALRLPARGRPVRRPRRPLPDRRRDGPGQDHPGHRRRRDHGPAVRRRARADRLPDLAQAPVAARDRALRRTAPSRSSAACAAAAKPALPPTPSSRSPITTPFIATST